MEICDKETNLRGGSRVVLVVDVVDVVVLSTGDKDRAVTGGVRNVLTTGRAAMQRQCRITTIP